MKRAFNSFLRIFVSLAFIVILLYIMRDKYGEITKILKDTNIALFLLSLSAFLGAVVVASFRFKLIIESQDIASTFPETVSLTLIGYFFNNFLPTSIGGDVVKAYYLAKRSGERMGSFASVFADRAIGFATMIFMGFAAVFFAEKGIIDDRIRAIIFATTAACVVMIAFIANRNFARLFSVLLFLFKPVEEKLRNAYNAVNKYRHHKSLVLNSVLISILSQGLYFSSIAILAFAVGARISAIDMLLRMPIVCVLSLLPSINGLGVREGAIIVFFGSIIGREQAFAVSILALSTLLLTSVIGGLVYGLSPQFRFRMKEMEG